MGLKHRPSGTAWRLEARLGGEMSIIRLTLIKDRLYAPTGLGALVDAKYAQSNGSRPGLLEVGVNPPHQDSPPESALTPSAELCDYLQFKASSEAAD